ncbi:MAG: hypothetical protein KU28_01235 [Sulfurovum sp. PC08-66]|nr:MAG: hypothetical protein KU28_01235 [Sulfurovum sp. PC08-66]KIM12580.1 MAG: hypothetical protein KU37_01350 [Sulfuricurvum sp. PC08-66]
MDEKQALLTQHAVTSASHLLLSPFLSQEWVDSIDALGARYTYVDVTLQGFIDMRMLTKAISTTSATHVVVSPFNNTPETLQTTLPTIHTPLLPRNAPPEILSLYTKLFDGNRDVTYFAHPQASSFALFLAPYLFCPKEEIVAALRQAKIAVSLLPKPRESLFVAHQVWQSFLGLPLDISLDEAQKSAQTLLAILEQHALRRCTF